MDTGTPQTPEVPTPAAAGLSLTALQRRRLLLRGVGKGGAVLAAAVPIASFANAPILKTRVDNGQARLCSVSGVGSVMVSMAVTTGTCEGQTARWWLDNPGEWPKVRGGAPLSQDTRFNAIFGGSGSDTLTFKQALSQGGSADKSVWARAYLNAGNGYPNKFPYQTSEVIRFYQLTDPSRRLAAFAFFRDWV